MISYKRKGIYMKKFLSKFLSVLLTVLFILPINHAMAFDSGGLLIYEDAKLTVSNTILYGTQNDVSFSFAGALSGQVVDTNVGLSGFSHKIVYKYADGSEFREEIMRKEVASTGKNANNYNIYRHDFKLKDTQDAIIIFDQIDVGVNIRPGVPNDEPNGDWSSISKENLDRTSFGYNKTATLNNYTVNFVELGEGIADSLGHNISLLNVDTFDKIEALLNKSDIDMSLGWEAKVNGEWTTVTMYESVFFTQNIAENGVITLRPFSPYSSGNTVYLEVNYKSAYGHECYQTSININATDIELIKKYALKYVETNIVPSLNHSLLLTYTNVHFNHEHYRNPSITLVYNCDYNNAYFGEIIPIQFEISYESPNGPQTHTANFDIQNTDPDHVRNAALEYVKNMIVPTLDHSPSLELTDVLFVGEAFLDPYVTFMYYCNYEQNVQDTVTSVYFEVNYESEDGHKCFETHLELTTSDLEQARAEALEYVKNQIVPSLDHAEGLTLIGVDLIEDHYRNPSVTFVFECNYTQAEIPSGVYLEVNYESLNGHKCFETYLELTTSDLEQARAEALEYVKNQIVPSLDHAEGLTLIGVDLIEDHYRNPSVTFVFECNYEGTILLSTIYLEVNYESPDGHKCFETSISIDGSTYEEAKQKAYDYIRNEIAPQLEHATELVVDDFEFIVDHYRNPSVTFVFEFSYKQPGEEESPSCEHDFKFVEGTKPTKDTPGTKDYYYCTKCNIKFYYGRNGEEVYFNNLSDIRIEYVEIVENNDGNLEAVIPENTVSSSIENSKEQNGAIKVEINVYDAIDKEHTITDVTLSEESINSILESAQDSELPGEVVIDISNATIILDTDALITASKIGGNKTLSVNVDYKYNHLSDLQKDALKGKDLKLSISASWVSENGEYISDFEGGNVTVMLTDFKPEKDKKLQDYAIVYVSEEGTLTIMPSYIDGNILCFITGHFSEFGVMAKNEAYALIIQQTLQHVWPYIIIALVLLLAVIILIVIKKRSTAKNNNRA